MHLQTNIIFSRLLHLTLFIRKLRIWRWLLVIILEVTSLLADLLINLWRTIRFSAIIIRYLVDFLISHKVYQRSKIDLCTALRGLTNIWIQLNIVVIQFLRLHFLRLSYNNSLHVVSIALSCNPHSFVVTRPHLHLLPCSLPFHYLLLLLLFSFGLVVLFSITISCNCSNILKIYLLVSSNNSSYCLFDFGRISSIRTDVVLGVFVCASDFLWVCW